MTSIDDRMEWLEADGRGGFASGTATGVRTRRYHALLLTAATPPTGRMVLVSGVEVCVDGPWGSAALSSQRYAPDVVHPDGSTRIERFSYEPWPAWDFRMSGSIRIRQEFFVDRESGAMVLGWTVDGAPGPLTLRVRLLMAVRGYHSLQQENGAFRFEPEPAPAGLKFSAYEGTPPVVVASNALYRHAPDWYRRFLYTQEQDRGLDAVEDLASPGEWTFTLCDHQPAVMFLAAGADALNGVIVSDVVQASRACRARELARRESLGRALDRAADAYVVQRGGGRTIVAGYPWFTDWGRDTFIALRGVCLTTGRLQDARDILVEWAGAVSEGMLPNRFPDHSEAAEYNSVDASLWYVVAVHDFLKAARGRRARLTGRDRRRLIDAVLAIVRGYAGGTRFGIRMDGDGLLAAGVRGQQLTWMDARVGDREITPRIGKPVEIQALWLNALAIASTWDHRWRERLPRGRKAFLDRFWDARRGYLADVVDLDHVGGAVDVTFRPNQILAVGGLPQQIVRGAAARRIVDAVEQRLLTPLGLRSLEPGAAGYSGRYEGGSAARDAVYHQGTAWPWLIGPFVDAWLRVRPRTDAVTREARERFVRPLLDHLEAAGLGHVSEIVDADAPFTPRGCPFQAWSVGELLRVEALTHAAINTTDDAAHSHRRRQRSHAAGTSAAAGVAQQ